MGIDERTWRIGDVAAATGLTVRALHHYDQIGLVASTARTAAGHRLYTDADLRKLYMVTALRQLGLSLEQVGRVLSADVAVRDVIDGQLAQVDRQIRTAQRLREQLLAAREADAVGAAPGLMAVIKMMRDVHGSLDRDQDQDQEQVEAMRRWMAELGVVAEHAIGVEMPSLYQEALSEMRAGTPASDQAVRRIVDRLDELSQLLRGSDQAGGATARRMWLDYGERNPDIDGAAEWGPLVAYLDEARAARRAPAADAKDAAR
ncbi:DNA-binding transcriptional MerR regulator [Catenulispora sp. EB89]|uniref:MerR family transcriptional regulator n=1 Tax=Catenulispora sp. EB89 TaxID=3156257 RepID=UPI00351906FE